MFAECQQIPRGPVVRPPLNDPLQAGHRLFGLPQVLQHDRPQIKRAEVSGVLPQYPVQQSARRIQIFLSVPIESCDRQVELDFRQIRRRAQRFLECLHGVVIKILAHEADPAIDLGDDVRGFRGRFLARPTADSREAEDQEAG